MAVSGHFASALQPGGRVDVGQASTNQTLCLSRWGYRFAHAKTDMTSAVNAVLSACEDAISMNAQAVTQLNVGSVQATVEQRAQFERDNLDDARRQANMYLVAGRAAGPRGCRVAGPGEPDYAFDNVS